MTQIACAPRWMGALAGLAVLVASAALATSCGGTPNEYERHADLPAQEALAEAAGAVSPQAASPFAVEEALGAECRPNYGGDPPLQGAACYGRLPGHVQSLLRDLPDTHPNLSRAHRKESVESRQWFRAVPGYGKRPDFVADITGYSQFWVRSFEGADADITIYVVYGPACSDDPAQSRRSVDDGCLPGAPYLVRELKVYRTVAGGIPEDVTSELAPSPPTLSPPEMERYGVYLRPPQEGGAVDTDIGLDVRRLATTPVMRWVIDPAEEGDYERPRIPDSDPRGYLQRAHFGFLIWTGERFELRERAPLSLWACGVGEHNSDCAENFRGDPYLVEAVGSEASSGRVP